jgi:hypothetical protein
MSKRNPARCVAKKPNKVAKSDDKFIAKIQRDMIASGPLLTCDQMDEIERTWLTLKRGRRCQLGLFTKPGRWIVDQIKKDHEFAVLAAAILAYTEDTMKFYVGLKKTLETASMRTGVALCWRTDMAAVVAEGKRRYLAGQSSELEGTE